MELLANADDIALFGDDVEMMKCLGRKLINTAEKVGLIVNDDKKK